MSANLLRVFPQGIQNPVKYLMDLDRESKIEVFEQLEAVDCFTKRFILDAWLGFEFTSDVYWKKI